MYKEWDRTLSGRRYMVTRIDLHEVEVFDIKDGQVYNYELMEFLGLADSLGLPRILGTGKQISMKDVLPLMEETAGTEYNGIEAVAYMHQTGILSVPSIAALYGEADISLYECHDSSIAVLDTLTLYGGHDISLYCLAGTLTLYVGVDVPLYNVRFSGCTDIINVTLCHNDAGIQWREGSWDFGYPIDVSVLDVLGCLETQEHYNKLAHNFNVEDRLLLEFASVTGNGAVDLRNVCTSIRYLRIAFSDSAVDYVRKNGITLYACKSNDYIIKSIRIDEEENGIISLVYNSTDKAGRQDDRIKVIIKQ